MGQDASKSDPLRGDQGSGGLRKEDGNLAEAAIAHLRRSGNPGTIFNGGSEEIDRQAIELADWARRCDALLPETWTDALKRVKSDGAEHDVFHRAYDNRAVKCTRPGTFGVTPDAKGNQRAATPAFYLQRIVLTNRVFPNSDFVVEGITIKKSLILFAKSDAPSIVISQPWINAADPLDSTPSEGQIADFMATFRFKPLINSFFGWYREDDGITILDARRDNFVFSSQGVIPIDLVITDQPIRS